MPPTSARQSVHFFGKVRLVDEDHGRRAAFPRHRQVPFDPAKVQVLIEGRHQEGRIDVGRQDLLGGIRAGRLAGEHALAWKNRLDGGSSSDRGRRLHRDPVAHRRQVATALRFVPHLPRGIREVLPVLADDAEGRAVGHRHARRDQALGRVAARRRLAGRRSTRASSAFPRQFLVAMSTTFNGTSQCATSSSKRRCSSFSNFAWSGKSFLMQRVLVDLGRVRRLHQFHRKASSRPGRRRGFLARTSHARVDAGVELRLQNRDSGCAGTGPGTRPDRPISRVEIPGRPGRLGRGCRRLRRYARRRQTRHHDHRCQQCPHARAPPSILPRRSGRRSDPAPPDRTLEPGLRPFSVIK